jgi:hypothetical protein
MYSELFSKIYGLRPTSEGLIYEDVPMTARIGLYHLIEMHFNQWDEKTYKAYLELYRRICVAIRIPRNRRVYSSTLASSAIEGLCNNCPWWHFYDICQVVWDMLHTERYYNDDWKKFAIEVNTLFREEQLGFEFKEGKIEKVGSGFIDAQVKEARYLLKEPEFKGADQQFEKAIRALNVRPSPDKENCIKDAIGAIESVVRIITNNEKAMLDDVIRNAARRGVIPKPLDQNFIKLYAYRGNEPGVAHGAVSESTVTIDEAELVLAMSAAMIIYLVKKRVHLTDN